MRRIDPEIIKDRINSLRKLMKEEEISLYMISDTDYHMSDVRSEYFNELKYMSGFSGYNGTMVVTAENAHLWTDARYVESATRELEGTGIILHIESDEDDTIRTIPKFFEAVSVAMLEEVFGEDFDPSHFMLGLGLDSRQKYVIGFDGRTFSCSFIDEIMQYMTFPIEQGLMEIEARVDLIAEIWKDRPAIPGGEAFLLGHEETGRDASEKIAELSSQLSAYGNGAAAVITAVDDVAWLYNIRGNDVPYSMTTYAYAYVNSDAAYLFVDESKFSSADIQELDKQGITLRNYGEFYGFIENSEDDLMVFDPDKTPFAFVVTADSTNNHVVIARNGFIEEHKAIKTGREVGAAFKWGGVDSAAVTRFIFWVKNAVKTGKITELDASNKLWELRQAAGAKAISFPTICAYQENSGNMNYSFERDGGESGDASVDCSAGTEDDASIDDDTGLVGGASGDADIACSTQQKINAGATLKPEGVLLVDSGAHYLGATTDTTRTIALGPVTQKQKDMYTLALASLLELGEAVFPVGMTDAQLDVILKKPLWEHCLDVPHVTGHGVGAMIDVQENGIALDWGKNTGQTPLQAGMLIACEPGLYFPGEFGVRLENIYKVGKYEDGYLSMIPMTLVPYDRDLINVELLTKEQIDTLNSYHQNVMLYTGFACHEDGKEMMDWLFEATKPL